MAAMSVEQMKVEIKKVYPGKTWSNKVDRMPEYQILAIYNRFLHSGKLK